MLSSVHCSEPVNFPALKVLAAQGSKSLPLGLVIGKELTSTQLGNRSILMWKDQTNKHAQQSFVCAAIDVVLRV